jgi:uncharacterized damage-inducible protein DinB
MTRSHAVRPASTPRVSGSRIAQRPSSWWRALLTVTLAGLVLLPAAAAQEPVAADLRRDWAAQKKRMLELADAMPAEKYEFKATPPQRTFGEQLHHLAEAHVRMLKALDPAGRVPAPAIEKDYGKAAVMSMLESAYDYGDAVLEAHQGALGERRGEATPARTVWSAMLNAMNHYGQCVVYLRLNDIVPPASRR